MPSCRFFGRVLAVGLLTAALPPLVSDPLLAQRTSFHPRLELDRTEIDNVRYVATGAEGEEADISTEIRVTLPVLRRLEAGSWLFQYRGVASRYRKNEELDNVSHVLRFNSAVKTSPVAVLRVTSGYSFTQDQAASVVPEEGFAEDPFVALRTEREALSAAVGYERKLSERLTWTGQAGSGVSEFSPIDGFDPGAVDDLIPEDKTSYQLSTSVSRKTSARTTIGADYSADLIDGEVARSGQVRIHRLQFSFSAKVTRRMTISGIVGGNRRTNDRDQVREETEAAVSFDFNEGLALGPVRFQFGAALQPSHGGALQGTSTNATAFASMWGVRKRPVDWRITAAYGERRPDFTGQPRQTVETLGGSMEFQIIPQLGLRLVAQQVEQDSTDPTQASRSFFRTRAGLVWYPLGRGEPITAPLPAVPEAQDSRRPTPGSAGE